MKKLKLLLAALILLIGGGGNIVWADTDYTSKVNNAQAGWTGATGTYANAKAAEQTVLSIAERYYGDNVVSGASTSIFSQTVTELDNGTYTVIFYATANNARCSEGNGGIQEDATDLVYVYAGSDKAHKTYVTSHYASSYTYPGEYIVSGATVTDGTLELGMYAAKTGTQWQTIQVKALIRTDQAANNNGVDMTKAIINADIYNVTQTEAPYGWTYDKRTAGNENRTAGTGNTAIELWNNTSMEIDVYQQISNLPNGAYKVTAYCHDQNGKNSYKVYGKNPSNSDETVGVVNVSGDDNYADITTSTYLIVTNGSINVGFKGSSAASWVTADNFRLTYYGPVLQNIAQTFPTNGAMTFGQWYKFTVPADGTYFFSPTSDIIISNDGDQLLSEATGDALTTSISLTAETTYYVKSTSNQTLSIKALADGYYFLKTSDNKYLSRGGNYNTQAIADNYGIPLHVTTNSSGISEFTFVDNGKNLFDADNGNIYTDNTSNKNFTIIHTTGGYYVVNENTTTNSTKGGKLYIDTSDGDRVKASTSNSTVWIFEDATTSAHKTQMQAVKDAQAAAVASAASIDASTQTALATYLRTNYGETNITITGTNGTIQESYEEDASTTTGEQLAIFAEETVDGLEPGIYCLSVKAFERITNADDTYTVGGAAGLTYVYATSNSATDKIQLHSLYDFPSNSAYDDNGVNPAENVEKDDKYYPNSILGAQEAFDKGYYINKIYVKVVDEGSGTGSIRFGIKKPHRYNASDRKAWVCYNDFSLVRFDAKATNEEKEALSVAINTAETDLESMTLGFAKDEYAPYNNIAVLNALAAAKAIDPDVASGTDVVSATTALTSALSSPGWSANETDVECVYNGNFAVGQGSSAVNIEQYGWKRTNNWGAFVNDADTKTSSGTAYYNQNGSMQYGNAGAYTMPLKANTIYTLTLKYASQTENSNNRITVSVLNNSDGMAAITYGQNGNVYSADNAFVQKTLKFVTGAAGNYILTIETNGNTVLTDISITKDANQYLEFADGSVPTYAPGTYPSVKITRSLTADKWVTAVYPFAVSGVTDIAELRYYDNSTLRFRSAVASTANKPFLMRSSTAKSEISLSNVAVAATVAEPTESVSDNAASLNGVYSSTDITDDNNYVLSSNTIYEVGTGGAHLAPYRAYIHISGVAPARLSFFVDDEPTSIEGISTNNAVQEAVVYNLQGQRIAKASKGLFIKQNGKKVVIR